MALKVKDAATAASKFSTRAAAAASDYAAGVQGSGQRWQQNATAASGNYATAVQDAISRDAFSKGVSKAGASKFENGASTKGAQRFPQGVRDGQNNWATGTQPYLATLAGLTLPPRRPKGDPANVDRVRAVTDALRKKKLGG